MRVRTAIPLPTQLLWAFLDGPLLTAFDAGLRVFYAASVRTTGKSISVCATWLM